MKTSKSPRRVKILLLPGDGVGPEIMAQAQRVIKYLSPYYLNADFSEGRIGGASIDRHGTPVTADVLIRAKESDIVLLGAVGGPQWEELPQKLKPEYGLLRIRKTLGLYANIRPVRISPSLLKISPIKGKIIKHVDFMIVRELAGGIYFGKPRGIIKSRLNSRAYNTEVYNVNEIARIARLAFRLASQRRRKVTSVDKANVLETSSLWRTTVKHIHKEFPEVNLEHMYVDNCAMQIIKCPRQFDIILTSNMFGDILSDESAMAAGSIGMLPSASLGNGTALYEPVHGSAPDIASKNIANPSAMILSLALMFRYSFGNEKIASAIETAVENTIAKGYRTADIQTPHAKSLSTSQMGKRILDELIFLLN